jgi:hypothetical protein
MTFATVRFRGSGRFASRAGVVLTQDEVERIVM